MVALLITTGVVVALGFLWFNVYYRNNRWSLNLIFKPNSYCEFWIYCGIILIRGWGGGQCSWIIKIWVTNFVSMQDKSLFCLTFVVRVTHEIHEHWTPNEQWWFHGTEWEQTKNLQIWQVVMLWILYLLQPSKITISHQSAVMNDTGSIFFLIIEFICFFAGPLCELTAEWPL